MAAEDGKKDRRKQSIPDGDNRLQIVIEEDDSRRKKLQESAVQKW